MNTHISFYLAKLLSQKKVTFPIIHGYTDKGDYTGEYSRDMATYPAPTTADVVMRLYEKHGIWVSVYEYKDHAADVNDDFVFRSNYTKQKEFNTPTEAYEAAIEYVLKTII